MTGGPYATADFNLQLAVNDKMQITEGLLAYLYFAHFNGDSQANVSIFVFLTCKGKIKALNLIN